jgi:hypothetical protein
MPSWTRRVSLWGLVGRPRYRRRHNRVPIFQLNPGFNDTRKEPPCVAERDAPTKRGTSEHAAAQSIATRMWATILPQAFVEVVVESLDRPPVVTTPTRVRVSTRAVDRMYFAPYVKLVSDEGNDTDRARYVSPTVWSSA